MRCGKLSLPRAHCASPRDRNRGADGDEAFLTGHNEFLTIRADWQGVFERDVVQELVKEVVDEIVGTTPYNQKKVLTAPHPACSTRTRDERSADLTRLCALARGPAASAMAESGAFLSGRDPLRGREGRPQHVRVQVGQWISNICEQTTKKLVCAP